MPFIHVDTTTPQPNGKLGWPAKTAFEALNDNFDEAQERLDGLVSSDAALGSRITPLEAAIGFSIGRNIIINGNFDFWQRGISFAASGYTADRWMTQIGAITSPSVVQGNYAPGDVMAAGTGASNYLACSSTGNSDAAGHFFLHQHRVENVNTYNGQQTVVRLRVYNAGAAGRKIALEARQEFGGGGSTQVNGIGAAVYALVAGWNTITHPINLPSTIGKTVGANSWVGLVIWLSGGTNFNGQNGGLGAQSGSIYFSAVEWVLGTVLTRYERRPLQQELALCQRYYEKSFDVGITPGNNAAQGLIYPGVGWNVQTLDTFVKFAVAKRAAPAITFYGSTEVPGAVGAWGVYDGSNWQYSGSATTAHRSNSTGFSAAVTNVSATIGNGVSRILAGHWAADAEV